MCFFYLASFIQQCFQGCIHIVACISTSLLLHLNSSPLYGYATPYPRIHQLMSISVVSTLGSNEWSCREYSCETIVWCVSSLEGVYTHSGIARAHGNSLFSFLRTCQTIPKLLYYFPFSPALSAFSSFSISSLTFIVVNLFYCSHLSRYEVVITLWFLFP